MNLACRECVFWKCTQRVIVFYNVNEFVLDTLIQKLNYFIFGYFNPTNAFFDNTNK